MYQAKTKKATTKKGSIMREDALHQAFSLFDNDSSDTDEDILMLHLPQPSWATSSSCVQSSLVIDESLIAEVLTYVAPGHVELIGMQIPYVCKHWQVVIKTQVTSIHSSLS